MPQPLLTFVIPVYNRKELLSPCLNSILGGGLGEYEIVLVDGASTDGAEEVCRAYAERFAGVTYYRLEENRGPGFARNFGAERAKGRFLFFVDSDDLVNTASLLRLFGVLRRNPEVDILSFNCAYLSSNGEEKVKTWITEEKLFSAPEFLDRYCHRLAVPMWSFVYSRHFFETCGMRIPETYNMEDMCFTAYALLVAKTVYALPLNLYSYRTETVGSLAAAVDCERNLIGFDACCKMLASLPAPVKNSPHFSYALRKCIFNMLLIPELTDSADGLRLDCEPEREPGIADYDSRDPRAFIARWVGFFCRLVRVAASGKKICFAPAVRPGPALARLFMRMGVAVYGFMDNNPAPSNPFAAACREEGYEILDFKTAAKRKDCLPVIFCYDGQISMILKKQLLETGLIRDVDFVVAYDDNGSRHQGP